MRIDLDAKIRTSDGQDAGSVQRAVLDPDTKDVRGFVVSTGGLLGREVIVPRDELERASQDGETLRLRLSKAQLEQMEEFVPERYGAPPEAWVPPPGLYGFPAHGYVWPATYAGTDVDMTRRSGAPTTLTLDKGSAVHDSGGHDVGVVEEVLMDRRSGEINGFVLRVGGALETIFGGGHTVEVGGAQIRRVGEGLVELSVGKDWLEREAGAQRDRAKR